jgi:hypothetical protein
MSALGGLSRLVVPAFATAPMIVAIVFPVHLASLLVIVAAL